MADPDPAPQPPYRTREPLVAFLYELMRFQDSPDEIPDMVARYLRDSEASRAWSLEDRALAQRAELFARSLKSPESRPRDTWPTVQLILAGAAAFMLVVVSLATAYSIIHHP